MALPATLKCLIAICFVVLAGVGSTAQEADFLPLQPHKVKWAEQVLRHAKVRKDSNLLAEYYYLYGKIYEGSGNLLLAKRYHLQSLRIQERLGNASALSRLYHRLSIIENIQLHYADTWRYARLSVKLAEQSGDDTSLLRAYGQIANLFAIDWQGRVNDGNNIPRPNYDSSLYYRKKGEPIFGRVSDPRAKVTLSMEIGREYLRHKDPKAIPYFEDALALSTSIQNKPDQVSSLLCLANATIAFGKTNEGFKYLQNAQILQNTLTNDYQSIREQFETAYVQYYQAIGNWKAALEHTLKLHELEKQSFLADREGAVTRLSFEYEIEKKEAQLKSQQKELILKNENLRTRNWLLSTISALLLLSLGAIAVYYRLYRQKERLGQRNAELVDEQNHRVKNNLQVISGLLQLQTNRLRDPIAISSVKDTQSRIEVMAVLQRKLYDINRPATNRLSEFIPDIVGTSLRSFGFGHLTPDYDVPTDLTLSPDQALAVGLIVNELTTNACKHAFPDHPDPLLRISAYRKEEALYLRIADNGAGFVPAPSTKGSRKSMGMKIIQLQVAQLDGTYRFDISGGTVFQMHFNV